MVAKIVNKLQKEIVQKMPLMSAMRRQNECSHIPGNMVCWNVDKKQLPEIRDYYRFYPHPQFKDIVEIVRDLGISNQRF